MHAQSGRDGIPAKQARMGIMQATIFTSSKASVEFGGADPMTVKPYLAFSSALSAFAEAADDLAVDTGDLLAWVYHLQMQGKGREVANALAAIDLGPYAYKSASFDPADN